MCIVHYDGMHAINLLVNNHLKYYVAVQIAV